MKERIGFIGMGLMGVPMTLRLLQAGFPVTVWNRSTKDLKTLITAGAKRAETIAELMSQSDLIMLCVSDTHAVEQVVFGEHGVAQTGKKEQLLVDFSSIEPECTRQMAEQLEQQAGMRWIDSPVSGGVAGAEQGTLAIMCGGQKQDIERVHPALAPLSQRVTRMGDVGAGQMTKICNQMLVSCNVLVMAEMMALAQKGGVDADMIPQALQGGFADSIPLQLTGTRMAQRDHKEVKWKVDTLLKDLDMAKQFAKAKGSSIPMCGLGAELMRGHSSRGYGEQDPSTCVEMYLEQSV